MGRALVLLDGGSAPPEPDASRRRLRARLLITRAFADFEVHGLERGRAALEAAADAAQACDSRDVEALVHELRGLVAARSGRLDDSLHHLDTSVSLIAHLDPEDRPTLLLNRGTVHLLRHEIRAAQADLRLCAELASALGMRQLEFKAQHNLGYAEFLAGDIPAALHAFAQADAVDTNVSRSVWFLDRARVLMEAGLLAEADQALASATALLRAERANQDRAEAELVRAEVALLQGDWSLAKSHATQARRAFRRRQSVGWQARADVTRWQASLDIRGGPARVARETRSVLDRADPDADTGSTTWRRQLALIAAEAQLSLGNVDDARLYLSQVGKPGSAGPLSSSLHQRLVRAGVARAAGDVAAARRELRQGLSLLADRQARHHSLDLRTAMALHGNRLAELDLRLSLESGSARTVFDSLERWRAMSHRRSAVTPPPDPQLADLLASLRLVTEELRGARPGQPVEHLRRRQRALERAVREREWTLRGDGRPERYASLARLRPALAERQTDVVAYFVLDHRLAAVAVVRGKPTVVTLGAWSDVASLLARVRADLDALAGRHLPGPLRRAITSSLSRDLDRLDRLLVPDAVADSANVLVVPARTLATVPWTLLPRRVGRPTTVSLSGTSWLRGAGEPVPDPRVMALAGPGLSMARREVADVAATWDVVGRDDAPFETAAALADALVSSDLVHIAAHGQHNQDNPLFSSIRMADGPLFAYDIPLDTPVAGHVVLSACDLGLTTPRPGGEVLGLTAALLSIGARSVVSSVSRVDDTTAYETMLRYHRHLRRGLDSPAALAEALPGDLDHPAAFVCFGSPWSVRPG